MKWKIDQDWTLFLDRDGVINERVFGGYILDFSAFHFRSGVLDALEQFTNKFGRIIVVTNQQCISLGLLSQENLDFLHAQMQTEIEQNKGRIDAVFAATELKKSAPFHRKPNAAMAEMAKERFPEIEFQKSIMVGDTDTDIQFGRNLGMKTVLLRTEEKTSEIADLTLDSLKELMHYLQ